MSWTLLASTAACSRSAKVAADVVLGSRQSAGSLTAFAGALQLGAATVGSGMGVAAWALGAAMLLG
jgi:hypothetical protein